MRTPKKSHEPIRQNGEFVEKSKKHDANLRKNSTLYFQIGLILCLLMTYWLFEMKFETKSINLADNEVSINLKEIEEAPLFVIEKPAVKEPIVNKSKPFIQDHNVVEDDTFDDLVDKNIIEPTLPKATEIHSNTFSTLEKKPEDDNVPYNFIQQVPVYPGCEKFKDNDGRKKCMSDKINQLVRKKFNADIASIYGLTGMQVIHVGFKIDKTGHVTDIETRSPHKALDEEAARVVKLIPNMTPGKQNDRNVGVIYNLPIKFQVQ